jgi:hypothetical protein
MEHKVFMWLSKGEKNTEKTKYMLLSPHQEAGKNHNIKIANRSTKNVAQFKYLGTTVTNQNWIHKEINLSFSNACYHSVQTLLSSCMLSKQIKIKIYKTIILPVVLYGCDSWLQILRFERLRVFENMVLRGIFGQKRKEIIWWRKMHNEKLLNLYSLPNIIITIKSQRMNWAENVAQMG